MEPFLSYVQGYDYYINRWKNIFVMLWTVQSVTLLLPVGNTAAIISNQTLLSEEDYPYQQIPAPQPLLIVYRGLNEKSNTIELERLCTGCKTGENGEMCSGNDQGECDCSSSNINCRCKAGWIGDACQYLSSKITCEKMRNCILCQVYRSGPLAEGKDCRYFCHHNYPTPLIVKTLHFQDNEHLCSFVHHAEDRVSEKSGEECRYFFKFGPILHDGSIDSSNLYIVAQQDMDCGKPVKFPPLRPITKNNGTFQNFAKNYEEVVRTSNTDDPGEIVNRKNNFFALVIIFVFIALPFVTCAFAVIYNFSNLPCGLCNKFRQSSSKYIRNVRPFPGFIPNEEVGTYFRNEDRFSETGRTTGAS